jgi:hypothetical protein
MGVMKAEHESVRDALDCETLTFVFGFVGTRCYYGL